jgi:hypothetical protein
MPKNILILSPLFHAILMMFRSIILPTHLRDDPRKNDFVNKNLQGFGRFSREPPPQTFFF